MNPRTSIPSILATALATALASALAAACTVVTPPAQPAGNNTAPVVGTPAPSTPAPSAPAPGSGGDMSPWDGPISCSGTEDITINNALIQVPGDGPTVSGSCTIYIHDSSIEAGGIAIIVRGSGDVILKNSTVTSRSGTAIVIQGSGDVDAHSSRIVGHVNISGSGDMKAANTVVEGELQVLGSGDYHDGGGNEWR